MNFLKHVPSSNEQLLPNQLDQIFPPERQRTYISMLMQRGGLTRRRAEYFVRLWAYLLLKQQQELGQSSIQPLAQLDLPEGYVACTHREAAELFYGHQERGSDRAAGMMIDRLAALGLLEKRFDGQSICLQIQSLPELRLTQSDLAEPVQMRPDAFNPRTDAIPAANLMTRSYGELVKDVAAVSHKVSRCLRKWSAAYPNGIRVLRRSDTLNLVAVSVLYPVASESEVHFFQPPSKSFYLTTDGEVDPFKIAVVGDPDCTSVYVRAWTIDLAHLNASSLCDFHEDTRQALIQMQADFPNLCDIYSMVIHPIHEELRQALGFHKICQDNQRSYYWVYLGIDRYLAADIKQAVTRLKLK